MIAIWCGEGKPILNEYLEQFVHEFINLSRSGIHINDHQIRIYIQAFICDTPARAYLKGYNSDFFFQLKKNIIDL